MDAKQALCSEVVCRISMVNTQANRVYIGISCQDLFCYACFIRMALKATFM